MMSFTYVHVKWFLSKDIKFRLNFLDCLSIHTLKILMNIWNDVKLFSGTCRHGVCARGERAAACLLMSRVCTLLCWSTFVEKIFPSNIIMCALLSPQISLLFSTQGLWCKMSSVKFPALTIHCQNSDRDGASERRRHNTAKASRRLFAGCNDNEDDFQYANDFNVKAGLHTSRACWNIIIQHSFEAAGSEGGWSKFLVVGNGQTGKKLRFHFHLRKYSGINLIHLLTPPTSFPCRLFFIRPSQAWFCGLLGVT